MFRSTLILLVLFSLASPSVAAESLRAVQQDLFRLGFYYTGPVDGVPGPRTDAAVRSFQRAVGADPTGSLSDGQRDLLAREAERVRRPRVWPVDETDRDASFADVRRGLEAAVVARDAQGVALFLADDAVLDFGGGRGSQELARRLGDPISGPALWDELDRVLRMGAVQTGPTRFCMPYVWCAERVAATTDHDMTAWVVVPDAVLRAEPDGNSEPVEALRYDVLEILGYDGDWARVQALSGDDAWLHRSQFRTPYDHRLLFRRLEGRWQVTAFVAGD